LAEPSHQTKRQNEGKDMTKEELLDQFAFEAMKIGIENNSTAIAREAYNIAEEMLERRQSIFKKWALSEAIVDQGIDKLGLTVRSENALKAEEIYTIDQLRNCTFNQLLKTSNLGRKSINEIIFQMNAFGFKLKGEL